MADFPTVRYVYKKSGEQWRDPILADFSKSGAFRGRRLQPAKKRTITVGYENLSEADRATIQTHYDAHRTTTFNFTWNDGSGGPYTVAYGGEPNWTKVALGYYDGSIILVEA